MLFVTALVLLASWLLGVLGVYHLGDFLHGLLLIGLLLLLLSVAHARDAAVHGSSTAPKKTP